MPIRRAALAAMLLLTACVTPSGVAVDLCNTSWRGLDPTIVAGRADEPQSVPISCVSAIDDKRVSIGFEMPPGPDCYELSAIDLEESADAVAITLRVSRIDDGGACPIEPVRSVTEIDLQSPVDDRTLLDGSR
jgi:hypothetical protein